jgi:hypothetical protein
MAFPALFVSHGVLGAALEDERFDPLFFFLGALDARDRVEDVYEGFRYGSLSLRALALAAP